LDFPIPIAEVSRIAASARHGTRGIGNALARETPSGNALVPVVATLRRSPLPDQRYLRHDLSFVTDLIAMHTRAFQRATPSEAQVAYRSIADQNHTTVTGVRIRQTA
jgi:hypothetical protein